MAPITPHSKVKVVLTGFEPFGKHLTNPSWLSVQPLNCNTLQLPPHSEQDPKHHKATEAYIVCQELPVEYRKVPDLVPALHAQHSRNKQAEEESEDFIKTYYIHVGVGRDGHTAIETQAHRVGYSHPDNSQWNPESKDIPPVSRDAWSNDPERLTTTIDTEALAEYLKTEKGWICEKSMDAGLYLCEYTFYLSMAERHRRIQAGEEGEDERACLFVHLPSVGNPYSLEELQQFVKDMVIAVVTQY
ncbi:hypothetical protein BX616_005716 [Lobosporangium transversale]|uniref:Peptidase C15, pyroglutamyl peptidase I-like protein n=1 Tax=Lobosporangium transversale TaxID=64571 RepID=A0A1Y2GJL9_9FUNG|nr:hypothetical protein BCR41DRAFT_357238 [Lobosporangium transversale]XP_021879838.1 hypothetical protein BCR41DRAFT_356865 [Lobosporangium transversale]KAF9915625.1 hypothetical protein BX616_005716 [Lobosporangium transversale]ORZ10953.1 hypothetical protein BCR41DRAFT_357238 [Lobosporangium transversale]ORZ11741.1 hypothetical protein BCR41DRAFT_356865 [Lobosporangium transversale]|eukprot:XP_021879470.1 hypothetical protein BCR41DRAFT_357238 [Lobosporangium transversale]